MLYFNNQKGNALVFALLGILAISTPLALSLKHAAFEEKMSSNTEQSTRALANAESGLKHALTTLSSTLNGGKSLDTLLTNQSSLLSNVSFYDGYYSVTLLDNQNGETPKNNTHSIILQATGTYQNATRNLEMIVNVQESQTNNNTSLTEAVLVNGDIDLGGSSEITGNCGNLHANGFITVGGSADVSGSISAVKGIDDKTHLISPNIDGNAAFKTVPEVIPSDYKGIADYILDSQGDVYDNQGNLLASTSNGKAWNGWSKTAESNGIANWSLIGNKTIDSATLYIEGDVDILGTPSVFFKDGWKVSIIAERSIKVTSNPTYQPNDSAGSFAGHNIMFLSGGDIEILGNATHTNEEGVYAAHEQVSLTGSSTLMGFIIAENDTTSNTHTNYASTTNFTGNTTIQSDSNCASNSNNQTVTTNYTFSIRSLIEVS